MVAAAPEDATLVIYHTAVLPYVRRQEDRDRLAETLGETRAVWISNEAPQLLPSLAAGAPPASAPGLFLLMRDAAPVAWTAPHGQSIDWFGPSD